MQPDNNPADWKQPAEQPSQSPYAAVPDPVPAEAPVVTLTPDEPLVDTVPLQPAQPNPQAQVTAENPTQPSEEPVHWQAQEYIQHNNGTLWYVGFGLVTIVLMAIAIFMIKSITFNILVPVMAAALLVYVNRPPRIINYTLSRQGLHINDRLVSFAEFKGFGVIHDGDEYSILLLPIKRFKPGVSVYFPEQAGEAIVDMLGARLPMQTLHLDIIDQIIRKLRI
ncbi:MAG TPA: hypothetical protein VF281_02385 [Candidatus Saccharimonadales bacterium]